MLSSDSSISFPTTPYFTDFFSHLCLSFSLSAFTFEPLFYLFHQCSQCRHSHQMFVMQDVCCLSTFRKLMWKEKGSKPTHCLEAREAKVQGMLATKENPGIPHSGKIWGLHQSGNTCPIPFCFAHVPLRLDVHECGYAASQRRSHLNWLRPSRSPKHCMCIFPTGVMVSDFLHPGMCIFSSSI